jgi:oxygen-independent coproporphyrinogen-3 oxidase
VGVNRVSLGAQTFQPHLLHVLERRATPAEVERAFGTLRDAGFENLSLDLIYGIPGQTPGELAADLTRAVALAPDHISAYELEAKPGTRFTIAHGAELERQADEMEGYFERVVTALTGAGYRWYETANFCRDGKRSEHNLGYWLGRDYLGIGVGAVSTLGRERRRNTAKLARYLQGHYDREIELLDGETRARERVMLGLRLDEPLPVGGLRSALDVDGLSRAERLGLAVDRGETLALTRRGRFLGGAVTAEILA